jgi:hypothetical protein
MQITVRTLFASVVATAVLAGAVGTLATAATSSQASPQAVAAAVQKVSDQTAQRELRIMDLDLKAVNAGVNVITDNQKELETTANEIRREAHNTCVVSARTNVEASGC